MNGNHCDLLSTAPFTNFVTENALKFVLMGPAIFLFARISFCASSALELYDRATSAPEIKTAEQQLERPHAATKAELQSFAQNKTKPGEKRYFALKLSLNDLSLQDQHSQILAAYENESDRDFLISAAIDMGGWLDDAHVREILKRTIEDSQRNECVQLVATESLAHLGDATGKEKALNAVLEGKPCNDFAVQALVTLKANDSIPLLQRCVDTSKDLSVQNACGLAILRIHMEQSSAPEKMHLLQSALDNSKLYGVQDWAARQLGEAGDPVAFSILATTAKSKTSDALEHEAAMKGLGIGVEEGHWTSEQVGQALH